MAAHDELSTFIQSSFPSVWSLEVLLLLKREPRFWSGPEIVSALRASDTIVSQSLASLAAGGLIVLDHEGKGLYAPASEAIQMRVMEVESVYSRSPDAVRRLIVSTSGNGLAAFADAFRFRRD